MTTKTHALVDGRGRPLVLLLTTGRAGDSPALAVLLDHLRIPRSGAGRPRTTPDALRGDKAYSARAHRDKPAGARREGRHPENADQQANRKNKRSAGATRSASTPRTTRTATSLLDSNRSGIKPGTLQRTLHVGLRVADLERSVGFDTNLGYEVLGTVPETEFGSLTMLKLPGDEFVALELVHDPTHGRVEPSGFNHLVVQVEDLHATVAYLGARGVHAEEPGSPDGSVDFWTTWLTDPDGYRIELVQWPDGHPDRMTSSDLAGPGQS